MPKSEFIQHGPNKQPWFDNHGDSPHQSQMPGQMVWNSYINATGSAVVLQPNTSTLVVPSRPERRAVFISHNSATGTCAFWFGLGHPAGLNAGLGPLPAFGSHLWMDGIRGLYYGPIYAIHDGAGPATLTWEEVW